MNSRVLPMVGRAPASPARDRDPDPVVTALPRIVWIELTSKCPFDCIFCSRKLVRGTGEHMRFELFASIVGQLREPEILRLNYSGESVHHPELIEAVALASATGAATELVSALATLPLRKVRGLVESGLERLTISLHAMDAAEYAAIYRHSSIDDLRARIDELLRVKRELASATPSLDFAFVAMERNLAELPRVAAYARELGVRELFVHPLIRRDPIPEPFPTELDGGTLTVAFRDRLKAAVDHAARSFPDLSLALSTREVDAPVPLGPSPRYFPQPLPAGARIATCDQNPFETIHILSNGDVVVCEVQDKTVLGNLRRESLHDIWHGEAYRAFRRRYLAGQDATCRTCAYKMAYRPAILEPFVALRNGPSAQLPRGFHHPECGYAWSKKEAVAVLANPVRSRRVRLRGSLPPLPARANELRVSCEGHDIGVVANPGTEPEPFDVWLPLPDDLPPILRFRFETRAAHRPARERKSADTRELGFALESVELEPSLGERVRRLQSSAMLWALGTATAHLPRLTRRLPQRKVVPLDWGSGVTVVIPERASPELLRECLDALQLATARVSEATEIIVVVNGSPLADYRALAAAHPGVQWVHEGAPLGFTAAVRRGVECARKGAIYLLNSDMTLEPDALARVLEQRSPRVFAVASQIFFTDGTRRREETGWTDYRIEKGRIELFDAAPTNDSTVRGTLYAGGGSSLFHCQKLLAMLRQGDPYHPFYFEDAEWGVRAWREGHEVLFCPASRAWHRHRGTVSRFYSEGEIDRIVERNRMLFQLRNFPDRAALALFTDVVQHSDARTRRELTRVRTLAGIVRQRLDTALAPCADAPLALPRRKFYPPRAPDRHRLPLVLVVSPYAVFPPSHGGAVRIHHLLRELARTHRIVLLSDEENAYSDASVPYFAPFEAVHLVGGRQEANGELGRRASRIASHSHLLLARELARLVQTYRPALVQVEYMELGGLVEYGKHGLPWVLSLHDVLLTERHGPRTSDDAREAALIALHDAVVVCSPEDAALLDHPRVTVVHNGAPTETRTRANSAGSRELLFMGPFRYPPNFEGIKRFLTHAYPEIVERVPDVTLTLLTGPNSQAAAREHPCFRQRGVRIEETISDPAPYLERCAMTLNPQLAIRGSSIKLIESLSAGRLCVSTLDGARGHRDAGLSSLVTVERIEDFAAPVTFYLTHEEARLAFERAPESRLAERSWPRAAEVLRGVYDSEIHAP